MQPAGTKEDPDAQYHNRGQFMFVLSPPRTVVAYRKVRCRFEHLLSSDWAWQTAAAATTGLCCGCSPAHTAMQQHANLTTLCGCMSSILFGPLSLTRPLPHSPA